ncbi:MAG TPA: hypothetical protein VM734_35430 [Kofleriaceae bacterium]|nr:hypothetical protein [Kofleriaceae bacterium]
MGQAIEDVVGDHDQLVGRMIRIEHAAARAQGDGVVAGGVEAGDVEQAGRDEWVEPGMHLPPGNGLLGCR